MSETDGSSPTREHVTFRAYHETNSPEEVTELLTVEPTKTQRAGDPSSMPGMEISLNGWFLSSKGEVDSKSFDAHLSWMAKRLEGKLGALDTLRNAGWELDLFGSFVVRSAKGPAFRAETFAALGVLGLNLHTMAFFSDEVSQWRHRGKPG